MKSKNIGVSATLFAAFLYATFGLFIREISLELDVLQQIFIRNLLVSGLLLVIGLIAHSFKKTKPKDRKTFIFRSIFALCDFILSIVAFNALPLGLVLFAFYGGSIITNYAYGHYVFKEKVTTIKLMSVASAFIGLTFMYYQSFVDIALIPLLAALGAGIFFALTFGVSKNLTEDYSLSQVNLYTYVLVALFSIPIIFFTGGTVSFELSKEIWYWLFGFTAVAVTAFYAILYGYKFLEAQVASLILLAEILFALIIGFYIYQEIPTVTTLIGGVFILIGLSLPNIKFKKLQ